MERGREGERFQIERFNQPTHLSRRNRYPCVVSRLNRFTLPYVIPNPNPNANPVSKNPRRRPDPLVGNGAPTDGAGEDLPIVMLRTSIVTFPRARPTNRDRNSELVPDPGPPRQLDALMAEAPKELVSCSSIEVMTEGGTLTGSADLCLHPVEVSLFFFLQGFLRGS